MERQLPFLSNFTNQQKYSISSKTIVLTLKPYQNKLFLEFIAVQGIAHQVRIETLEEQFRQQV